jgi:hypothetical protein
MGAVTASHARQRNDGPSAHRAPTSPPGRHPCKSRPSPCPAGGAMKLSRASPRATRDVPLSLAGPSPECV